MRKWFILACLLPCAAQAREVHVQVDYVIRQERVGPQPQIVHPRISQHFVLHEEGAVDTAINIGGKQPEEKRFASRLGGNGFKVVDDHTISRSWSLGAQRRNLTITTQGSGCTATLEISGSPEFSGRTTDGLNQLVIYRNSQVESISCRIQ